MNRTAFITTLLLLDAASSRAGCSHPPGPPVEASTIVQACRVTRTPSATWIHGSVALPVRGRARRWSVGPQPLATSTPESPLDRTQARRV